MKVELTRIIKTLDGVFGAWVVDNVPFCVTLEPEDKDNQSDISCIPEGSYICKRRHSPKYGDIFEVTEVPNRTHILIHAGNTEDDTLGCILLGQHYGKLTGLLAVLNSGKTFNAFMAHMEHVDEFLLTIKEM